MKSIVITFFSIFCFLGFSQSTQDNNPLISYTYIKKKNPIFKQDSLIKIKTKKKFNLEIFKAFKNNKEKFLRTYEATVFKYTSNPNRKYPIIQWNTPILIYFDKALPKTVKQSLVNFINQIKHIDNLEISLVRDKNEANYLIHSTNKIFNIKSYKPNNEKDRLNYVFNNGIYKQIRDNTGKVKACVIELNNIGQTFKIMKKTLRQLFYLSLGRFSLIYYKNGDNSLLNPKYRYDIEISELDLAILRIHYNVIFNTSLTKNQFRTIIKPIP